MTRSEKARAFSSTFRPGRLRKILVLLGLAPLLALVAGFVLWRFWPAPAAPANAERLSFQIGGHRLVFRADYVRWSDPPDPDRIDLVALAPDFTPAAANSRRLPAAGEADDKENALGRAQVFLSVRPAPKLDGRAASAAPSERYGPYLEAEAQVAEGGLLRRRFEADSPYAGEDLYLAPPDGEEFYARCQRPKIPSDGLPATCLSEFSLENLRLDMRFDAAWLGDWAHLRANALLLVRSAMGPDKAPVAHP